MRAKLVTCSSKLDCRAKAATYNVGEARRSSLVARRSSLVARRSQLISRPQQFHSASDRSRVFTDRFFIYKGL